MNVGMKLLVVGLGMAVKLGRTADVAQLLTENRVAAPRDLAGAHTVTLEIPHDFKIAPQLIRRMGHFAKLSLASACDALRDSGLGRDCGNLSDSRSGSRRAN
jgi:3-oxoacyl-(acyl-carrier-protein) synthase